MSMISIIVPVYNVENYLKECLQSITGQTYKDLEIILVDDGSTDCSGNICDEFAKKDKRIRVIHQKNQGQSVARNIGVSLATGEYILFVDSDDYIIENACEKLVESALETQADIITADILNEKDRLDIDKRFRSFPEENIALSGQDYLTNALKLGAYDIVPFIRLVKKEYLDKINLTFKEGCYYEDQLYTLQLFTLGGTVTKIRFPFYYYRMDRAGSTTNVANLKKGLDFVQILREMVDYIKHLPDDNQIKNNSHIILGLAVYHLACVWLKMTAKDQKIVWKQLQNSAVLKYCKDKTVFNSKRIKNVSKLFISHRCYLNWKNKIKEFIKKRVK